MTLEEQQVLQQGIKDYVDALNAINAFRSLVQNKCRRVVEDNLEEYAAALGIELSKKKLMDYESFDGSECHLGVRCVVTGVSYTELGHGIWWGPAQQGGLETGIIVWVWSKSKNIERLREVLRQKRVQCDVSEEKSVSLYKEITADDAVRIADKLASLMEEWISLWRKAGGIKALVGKSAWRERRQKTEPEAVNDSSNR